MLFVAFYMPPGKKGACKGKISAFGAYKMRVLLRFICPEGKKTRKKIIYLRGNSPRGEENALLDEIFGRIGCIGFVRCLQ